MSRVEPTRRGATGVAGGTEILVLDPAVEHAERLLEGVRPGIEVLRLAPDRSGLGQVAGHLEGRTGVTALHVVSHGEPGVLLLAGERVDLPMLAVGHGALRTIAAALAPGAEVLLYGCSIASGPAGRRLVEYLEDALGAPVAAALGPVGSAEAGGGWTLSRRNGGMPVRAAFSAEACAAYPALLAGVALTGGDGDDLLTGGDGDDTLIGGAGADTLSGDLGADHLSGGAGDDVIRFGNEAADGDVIDGGAGTDTLRVATYGDFTSVGSIAGIEVISLAAGASAVFSDMFDGAATVLTGAGTFGFMVSAGTSLDLASLDTSALVAGDATIQIGAADGDDAVLIGPGAFGAVIVGAGGADLLRGGGADDWLSGGAGNDTLSGAGGDDTVSGGAGNDVLSGGGGEDRLYGGTGDDLVFGGAAGDVLSGGEGDDTLSGGSGDDNLHGGDGHDVLVGGAGDDFLTGGAGDDTLLGGVGVDELLGGGGSDVLSGGGGDDDLCGEDGNDLLLGGDGDDRLCGGDGDDVLRGGGGADTLAGGDGADALSGGAGVDRFLAGADDTLADWQAGEVLVLAGAAGLTNAGVSRAGDTLAFDTDGVGGVDVTLTATGLAAAASLSVAIVAGDAHITYNLPPPGGGDGGGSESDGGGDAGSSGMVVVDQPPASDTASATRTITNQGAVPGSAALVQNTGNNGNLVTATLPAGATIVSEGPGAAQSDATALATLVGAIDARDPTGKADLISSAEGFLNALAPGTAVDIRTIVPTASAVSLDGPMVISGSVPVAGSSQVEAFVIDVRGLPPGTILQLDNIEFVSLIGDAVVTGGAGNNHAIGDDGAQFISLGAGDDTLYGGGGHDTVASGDGADLLFGEAGNDTVIGGVGADTLWGGVDQDVVYGNQTEDVLYGNQGLDTLYGGQQADTVFGGQHEDLAYGNLGDDVLYGNLGADTLYGGQGDDVLYGGRSDGSAFTVGAVEVLYGNLGDDTLIGGRGDDLLHGGGGADLFVIDAEFGNDTVADFDGAAGDRVQVGAGTDVDSFAELLAMIGTAADGSVQVDIVGNVLVLAGVRQADLQSGWFTFG